jgi:hypothetical protein
MNLPITKTFNLADMTIIEIIHSVANVLSSGCIVGFETF